LIYKASSYIYEDSESGRIKKAKVLGRDLKRAFPADVLDFLIEQAEKDPVKITNLYEGEDWKIHLFVLEAIEKGVIRKEGGIYKYDDKLIGGSMNSVIDFMKDVRYKKLIDTIKRETYPELLPKQELVDLENEHLANITDTPIKKGTKTK
jgi:hypothetical protein